MRIIGMDYPCLDMGVSCAAIPEDGGWSPITDMTLQCGGKVPNALVASARLGAETAIIGSCGTDRYGRLCRSDLEYNGVSTERLAALPGKTGLCICLADAETAGKRCIESASTYARLRPQDLDGRCMEKANMLLLYQMDEAAVQAAKMARAEGAKVLVDGDEFDTRTQNSLYLIDILIVSEYYYGHLFGKSSAFEVNLRTLQNQGPDTVIVTLGAEGCAGVAGSDYFRVPSFHNVSVVDTTGAGDVFHGAYGYFSLSGFSAREAAIHASAVSAIKCTRLGGRTGIPTRGGVEHFIRTGTIDPEDFDQRAEHYRNVAFECSDERKDGKI